ncbi:cysteine-rich protein 2-binding protein [Trichonephila inaurata madagascariensis]|uniref:Cysteine-rich protein 2-binding protein n=1 Tax=Trichonephila inaurata madagascariensis TaxID=2747483 RepID=A0A8X6X6N0_9ARAC|nr:cysteine-rich protein 2-binding protein [Trichonephila inaurata madagascariensis]
MEEKPILHCYCLTAELQHDMLTCIECKKRFHLSCLKSGRPSSLAGDIYFNFTCQNCSHSSKEIIKRKKLQWILVIMIALYNLQLEGVGRCGYFRWREHICRFIDRNWAVLFGEDRKKSATWHGTVAGALSTGANRFFVSGVEVLGENGWWSLKSSKLPSLDELNSIAMSIRATRKRQAPETEISPIVEGTRKKNQNVIEAAVALKEKKASIDSNARSPKPKKTRPEPTEKNADSSNLPFQHKLKLVGFSNPHNSNCPNLTDENCDKNIPKEEDIPVPPYPCDDPNDWIKVSPDIKFYYRNPVDSFEFPKYSDDISTYALLIDACKNLADDMNGIPDYDSEEENSDYSKTIGTTKKLHPDTGRKRRVVPIDETPNKEVVPIEANLTVMSPFEEGQLLQKLQNHYTTAMKERPEVRRLYRKLMVRKLKRERNLPVFDIDAQVRALMGMDPPDYMKHENSIKSVVPVPGLNTVLDRFQVGSFNACGKSQQQASFLTRHMGLEGEEEISFVSPYTERVLKPIIFQDYSIKPLKIRLLEEVLHYTNKNNPNWLPPAQSPINYCYVRPQHIPGINALCHEFFWPGIDVSECLQYPDFSCVVLYKKLIIGFAFLVPDVKYNEAYVTFIFCHPEWQRSGIGSSMLYYLVQTCKGKDVTLHVPASSTAISLYCGIDFEIEQFIHNFYDKYLPPNSKECRHAYFLRLSRYNR